ncbi:MAG TPA: sigma-70 family RNA polymerase sigma factor [Trebonia sp.]|jgi:RNA polymerase sigma factor (sigma-70 family)|nr:sigma-70 family RNA polymerase sigma factor [Trebonia sp.]
MDDQLATASGTARGGGGAALAVDELIPIHSPMLWQVARAAGLGSEDAEDVVQTVWESLLTHLDSIRSPAALTGWLVVATRREAWRVAAARRRLQPADHEWLLEIPDPRADSEQRVVAAEEQRALWDALLSLDQRCQELLRIVAFVPRPDYDLVAERLKMRRGSVGPTRGRCLEKLRAALGGGGDREEERK